MSLLSSSAITQCQGHITSSLILACDFKGFSSWLLGLVAPGFLVRQWASREHLEGGMYSHKGH